MNHFWVIYDPEVVSQESYTLLKVGMYMAQRYVGSQPRPSMHRLRLSVPTTDISVLDWLGAQSDVNASVRTLIREAIAHHGYEDVTCLPVDGTPAAPLLSPKPIQTSQRSVDTTEQKSEVPQAVAPKTPEHPSSDVTEGEASANVTNILGSLR